MKARHSMDSPDWTSPKRYVEAARKALGRIDLDPMSDAWANRTVKAKRFYTRKQNGLIRPWKGRVFLNPAGGHVKAAWTKLTHDLYYSRVSAAIWIGYSLEQLQSLQRTEAIYYPLRFPICVPDHRIAFVESPANRRARIARIIREGSRRSATKRQKAAAAACRAGKPPKDAPSHGNFILYMGPHPDRFRVAFATIGQIVIPRKGHAHNG